MPHPHIDAIHTYTWCTDASFRISAYHIELKMTQRFGSFTACPHAGQLCLLGLESTASSRQDELSKDTPQSTAAVVTAETQGPSRARVHQRLEAAPQARHGLSLIHI